MISPKTSYVKIWMWELCAEEKNSTPFHYGHVAIETYLESSTPQTKYISYWANGEDRKGKNLSYFHTTKEEDDRQEQGKIARCYSLVSLDIAKINKAFEVFRQNPKAWGALGWGILGKAYAHDCYGLTVFLLEKGGIFKCPYVLTDYKFTSLLKKLFFGLGCAYSGINLLFCYDLHRTSIWMNRVYQSARMISLRLPDAYEHIETTKSYVAILSEMSEQLNRHKVIDIGPHQQALTKHSVSALQGVERLNDINLTGLAVSDYDLKKSINISKKVSRQLMVASIISLAIVFIFNYINNRFILGRYDAKKIKTLIEKAIYFEQKKV